ncbi:MAG: SPFH domain-containing protein, partial [Treponema sp.]|nr:SPFH domain-containing protein [Treponema sp.]
NAFTGGISTFNCVVYFVRKAHSMEILWGTSSPIQVRDKLLGIATKLRARGSYKIQVDNPQKFLTKLIGNNINIMEQQELLDDYFANEFQSKIKASITRALNETQTELLGIEARLEEFAETVEPFFGEVFNDYGLKMVKFSIAALDMVDDELRKAYDLAGIENLNIMRKAQADAAAMATHAQGAAAAKVNLAQGDAAAAQYEAATKITHAQGDKGVMDVLGNDWNKLQSADILKTLAANPGAGGIAAAGAGLGMGMAAGGVFSNMANQFMAPMQQTQPNAPPQPSGRFTQKSAQTGGLNTSPTDSNSAASSGGDPLASLKKLKEMLDLGLIEQAEFDAKKAEIMNRM